MVLIADKLNRIWLIIIGIFGIALWALLAFVLTNYRTPWHARVTPAQRQEAISRAEILSLYVTIRQLEEDRGKLIEQIVREQDASNSVGLGSLGNINGLVYRLAKNDHLANLSLLSTTNIAGVEQFVDVWGHPYDIELLAGAETNYGNIRIRVKITSVGHN